MPGPYAHITLVNVLREKTVNGLPGMPGQAKYAVNDEFKYCELGAVSPDYPYLALLSRGAAGWADNMHYTRTGQMIKEGVTRVRQMSGQRQQKSTAWLLGYAAHFAADVFMHPVINRIVGPYEENKTAHRECEMNQDALIFAKKMNLGQVGLADYLESGLWACTRPEDDNGLDGEIAELWDEILKKVHPVYHANNTPDMNAWHKGFKLIVDKIAAKGGWLIPFGRHYADNLAAVYPTLDNVDAKFTLNLPTPADPPQPEDYEALFDRAADDVGRVWEWVGEAIYGADESAMANIGNWDLDTGEEVRGDKNLIFWS